jgi:hypothetical protein
MKHKLLQELSPLNPVKLNEVFNEYGMRLGSVYQIKNSELVQLVVAEGDRNEWPVSTPFNTNYTPNYSSRLPVGWVKLRKKLKGHKIWPKGVHFYYPFQNDFTDKIVFVIKPMNPRVKEGTLSAPLEVIASRVLKSISQHSLTTFVNETVYSKAVNDLSSRMQKSFSGFFEKHLQSIGKISSGLKEHISSSYMPRQDLAPLKSSSSKLSEVFEELEVGFDEFKGKFGLSSLNEPEQIDLRPFLFQVIEDSNRDSNNPVDLKVIIDHEKDVTLLAPRKELAEAIYEVLTYSAEHSAKSEVTISVFISSNSVVLDILDDGPGVQKGMENLIFLKYYRQRTIRDLKKMDVGLGLEYSRSIARELGGDLLHVRNPSGGSVFRFILPLSGQAKIAAAS